MDTQHTISFKVSDVDVARTILAIGDFEQNLHFVKNLLAERYQLRAKLEDMRKTLEGIAGAEVVPPAFRHIARATLERTRT